LKLINSDGLGYHSRADNQENKMPNLRQYGLARCCTLLAAMITVPAFSDAPSLSASALTQLPKLDGDVLNDPAWQGVAVSTGFTQTKPDEAQPATQRTEVRVAYSEKHLYISAVLYDNDPASIIISDARRDASLDDSDAFAVLLDGFKDGQNGLLFATNPAGIQYDAQVIKESDDYNEDWDTDWQVSTDVGDYGWSVEMAIPFKSLRYGKQGLQDWGINFQRNIRRRKEKAYWAPLPRQHSIHRVSEAGTLSALKAPAQRNLKLIPYALGRLERGDHSDGTETDSEFGLDLKYSITPSLTLDATYNTDFAQAEVDNVVVNLDRFSVFLPEKRLFFLENADQFAVGTPQQVELFFSRRIGLSRSGQPIPIDGGLRLSGKISEDTNIGLLHMRTDEVTGVPGNDFSVIRLNQELGKRSALGGIYVRRDGDGGADDINETWGLDGRLGIGDNLLLTSYIAKTRTPGLDGKDHALRLKASFNSEHWINQLGYAEVGEDFNPEVGFVSRRDYRKVEFLTFRRIRPDDLWGLQEMRPHISYNGYWDFDGQHESGFLHVDNHWEFKSGMEIHTGINFIHEYVDEAFTLVDGARVQPGEYDEEELQLVFWTNQGAPVSFEIEARWGGFFGGDKLTLEPILKFRRSEKLTAELSWFYNKIDLDNGEPNADFDINVGILKLAYAFTPQMALETQIQYDDRNNSVATNVRFSWLNSGNSGLYVVYNEFQRDELGREFNDRELVVKFSYLFDVL
jgi:hypothetical protein